MPAQKHKPGLRTAPAQFSHLSRDGALKMVDVSAKSPTLRTAVAAGTIQVGPTVARLLRTGGAVKKGNVFEAARLAGILAAKRVDQLIPLCHGLPLEHVRIDFRVVGASVHLEAETRTTARTGVEMEALTAVSVAALTIYDMCKAVTKAMTIGSIRLIAKTGGKSGDYRAKPSRRR